MSEKGLDLRNNKGGNGGGGSAAGGSIKILFIGNSNMIDSVAYLPAVLKNINPNVKLTVGAAYLQQSCLGQHLAYFTGADAEHKVTAYGYDYWVEGNKYKRQPTGGGDINTYNGYSYYKSVNGAAWSDPALKLAAEILADVRWDVIVNQDAPDIHDWANIAPYLFPLQQYIGNNVGHAVKFGWLMTHAWTAADEATILGWWHSIATVATEVMEQTAASILLAPGTAVQNMRTIASLAALGDGIYKNLCKDTKHLQEGLGPLGAAYAVAVGILNAMGLEYQSVIGEQTRPTAEWIAAQNVPGQHLGSGVVGITNDNCLLAQVAAVNATKYPYKVISPSLSANANDRIVDEVEEFIPAPATPGTENQMLAIDANGNPVWVNPAAGSTVDTALSTTSTNPVQNQAIATALAAKADKTALEEVKQDYLKKGEYDASTAVGLADNLRGNVYADEQFSLRMTGGEANEVGGIGVVQQLKGAGAAIVQLFTEGSGHDFSGDVSLDGTGGNAEAPVRYSDNAATTEMGYLLAMEAFISQTLSQAQLDAISAKDSGKADRDKAVWLTPAGAITSAPTIESGQTEVTFSGWRIAMRVKASEVRDASASSYWFTSGTKGRQVYDVAVAEGIDGITWTQADGWTYGLANGWHTKSAMEYLQHMAAQGLPTHSVKAMSALLAVTKIGIKTVKSRNLLNPQTGRALLKAYVNDDESFEDNEYTMLGGLPSGSTMAFTSLLTGKTETLTMLDSTHFVIPSDGWLQITGTLPTSIIATWDGTKDNTAADEYATESHVWDVTQLFGTKDGGTEGHYYRFAKEGMRGAGSAQDVVELVGARGEVKVAKVIIDGTGTYNMYSASYIHNDFTDAVYNGITWNDYNPKALCGMMPKNPNVWNKNENGIMFNGANQTHISLPNSATGIVKGTDTTSSALSKIKAYLAATPLEFWYAMKAANYITFTSLFLSASSTDDELTAMPADAIPLSEIQFADNNWSIEEAIYDAPEADANGVIDTLHQCTGQMRIQYSLDAAEQILTLQTEYAALEARVTALENA